MPTAYTVAFVGAILILALDRYCAACRVQQRSGLAYYLARNLLEFLWPVVIVAGLFSAVSLALVYLVNDGALVGRVQAIERRLDWIAETVEAYSISPEVALALLCILACIHLTKIPSSVLGTYPWTKDLAPTIGRAVRLLGSYRKVQSRWLVVATAAAAFTFFPGADAEGLHAIAAARLGEAKAAAARIEGARSRAVAEATARDLVAHAAAAQPPELVQILSDAPNRVDDLLARLGGVQQRYRVELPAARAALDELRARYRQPSRPATPAAATRDAPSPGVWRAALAEPQSDLHAASAWVEKGTTKLPQGEGLAASDLGQGLHEALVEALLQPNHVDTLRALADGVPLMGPLLDAVAAGLGERLMAELPGVVAMGSAAVIAGKARVEDAVADATAQLRRLFGATSSSAEPSREWSANLAAAELAQFARLDAEISRAEKAARDASNARRLAAARQRINSTTGLTRDARASTEALLDGIEHTTDSERQEEALRRFEDATASRSWDREALAQLGFAVSGLALASTLRAVLPEPRRNDALSRQKDILSQPRPVQEKGPLLGKPWTTPRRTTLPRR